MFYLTFTKIKALLEVTSKALYRRASAVALDDFCADKTLVSKIIISKV
jgi:hypothetical protein